ncbi:MAG TPA: phasin family protein [Burkholderiaceae bacterium]
MPKVTRADRLAASCRKDLDAIAVSSRTSCAGLQAVVQRQAALIDEAIGEWRTVARVMAEVGPWLSVRHLDKLAIASLQLALADIRELAMLAARSQREAFDIMRQRIHQHILNVQRLLRA